MALKASIKFGSNTVQVEADEPKELFREAGFFTDLPQECGHCKSKNIAPHHRKVKSYDFYSIKCLDCLHEFGLGQAKEGGHLFPKWKDGWKAPFSKDSDSTSDDSAWD